MIGNSAMFVEAPRMIRRALVLWLLARIAIMMVSLRPQVVLSSGSALIVVAAITVLCYVDARAMREEIFFANLGRPAWAPAAIGFASAVTIELVLAAGARLVMLALT